MDNFNEMMKIIRSEEGGIAKLVGDNGGYTYLGIAQNFWGSKYKNIFDRIKLTLETSKNLTRDVELQKMVNDFYYKEFWVKIGGDKIPFIVAKTMMNDAINSGISTAIKAQESICGLTKTGVLSQSLINAINNLSTE